MKSQRIVNQILYADASLSMEGIIPSISLWYEKMQRQIFTLQQTLQADGASPAQAAALCFLICEMLDKRINALRMKNYWGDSGYSLTVYLFGQTSHDVSLTERLRDLAQGQTGVVSKLSHMLLGWLSLQEGSVQCVRLLNDCHQEPYLPPVQPKPASGSGRVISLLMTFLSASFLISLWFILKIHSHV